MDTTFRTEPNVLRTIIQHIDTPTAGNMRLAAGVLRDAVDRDFPQTLVQKTIRSIGKEILRLEKPGSLQMTVSLRKDRLIKKDWNEGESRWLRDFKLRDANAVLHLAKKFEPMAEVLGDAFVENVLRTPRLYYYRYGTMVKWVPDKAVTAPVMHGLDEAGHPYFLLSLKAKTSSETAFIQTAVAFSLRFFPSNPPTLQAHEILLSWHSVIGLERFSIAQQAEEGEKDSLGYSLVPAKTFIDLLAGERVTVEYNHRTWQLSDPASLHP